MFHVHVVFQLSQQEKKTWFLLTHLHITHSTPSLAPPHHWLHPITGSTPSLIPPHPQFHPITGSTPSLVPPHHWFHPITGSTPSLVPPHHWFHPISLAPLQCPGTVSPTSLCVTFQLVICLEHTVLCAQLIYASNLYHQPQRLVVYIGKIPYLQP